MKKGTSMTNATTAKAAIAIAAAGTLAGLGATAPANAASTARGFVPRTGSQLRTGSRLASGTSEAGTAARTGAAGRGFVPRRASDVVSGPQAEPDTTGVKCAGNYHVSVCAQIIGHGLVVSRMWMKACNYGSFPITYHDEILSPHGAVWNTTSHTEAPGDCLGKSLKSFDASSGEWHFRAWQKISGVWYDVSVQRGVAK
jgi:hypothetical protein